ncbi:MAG: c-type cytochrome biogenesis protein CcsB [Halobacteriota archaeon]
MDIAALEHLGFEIAIGAYLISSILFILYLSSKKRRLADTGFTLTAFGFAFQTLALVTRWFYAGHPPWVNTYEVMSFFAWTIVGAYLVLNIRTDYKSAGTLVAPLAFATLGFASLQPSNPTPLIPALQSVWLLIHVPIVVGSYCALFIAFVASILFLFKDKQLSEQRPLKDKNMLKNRSTAATRAHSQDRTNILDKLSLTQLDDLAYRSVAVGFPLLTIGIITGAIWAEAAWGSYWSWDPKETWSLITWFVFLIYLHVKTQNWSSSLAAYIATFGFISVVCTFLGVAYVLPFLETYISVSTGLHSYAGGGDVAGTVFFCGIVGFVFLLLLMTRKKPPQASDAPLAEAAPDIAQVD